MCGGEVVKYYQRIEDFLRDLRLGYIEVTVRDQV